MSQPHQLMMATILLLLVILSVVSAYLVTPTTRLSIRTHNHNIHQQYSRRQTNNKTKSNFQPSKWKDYDITSTTTQLSLGIDPSDIAQHVHTLHEHTASNAAFISTISDHASSTTSELLAQKVTNVIPNQSLAPLSDTIQSALENTGNAGTSPEIIPDIMSMPGGVPRSGNAFLSESFKELYGGTLSSRAPPPPSSMISPDGTLTVPAKEIDMIGRYADLLSRIPLAAATYALIDFFIINAEEDIAIQELMMSEDLLEAEENGEGEILEAIMDVENKVIVQRFVGVFGVVVATIVWSLIRKVRVLVLFCLMYLCVQYDSLGDLGQFIWSSLCFCFIAFANHMY